MSIIITLAGGIAFFTLPMAQYPQITPPTIQIDCNYPGANAQTVADNIAAPIEQQVNGVENMMYMSSQSTSDGSYTLTVTFRLGVDLNEAQVLVQNRVNLALPQLPAVVQATGITTRKRSSEILLTLSLYSPDHFKVTDAALGNLREAGASRELLAKLASLKDLEYSDGPEFLDALAQIADAAEIEEWRRSSSRMRTIFATASLHLSNYALIHLREEIQRLPGISDVLLFGQRDYSMRIWINPELLAARELTPADVVAALQEQNVQVAAGQVGQAPMPRGQAIQITFSTLGRLATPEQFEEVIVKKDDSGRVVRIKDIGALVWMPANQDVNNRFDGRPTVGLAIFMLPDANALETADLVKDKMKEMSKEFPEGITYEVGYDTTPFIRESVNEVFKTLREAVILVAIVVLIFLQSWRSALIPLMAVPVAIIGTFAAMAAVGFSLNNLTLFGLVLAIGIVVDDAIVVVEAVEHFIELGLSPRDATIKAMEQVSGTDYCRRLRAYGSVHSVYVHHGHRRPVLPAVRSDHRDFGDHLDDQFTDAQPGSRRPVVEAQARATGHADTRGQFSLRLVLSHIRPRFSALGQHLYPYCWDVAPGHYIGCPYLRRSGRSDDMAVQAACQQGSSLRKTRVISSPACSCPTPLRWNERLG